MTKSKERANQYFIDPAVAGCTYSLLHKAVQVGCGPIVEDLLRAGADVNATDNKGQTTLHWLAAGASSAMHTAIASKRAHLPRMALQTIVCTWPDRGQLACSHCPLLGSARSPGDGDRARRTPASLLEWRPRGVKIGCCASSHPLACISRDPAGGQRQCGCS